MYKSALRDYTRKRIEQIEKSDILVGIPCYNSEKTIAHVIKTVSEGLHKHFNHMRNVVFIADGGSTDDTREIVKEIQLRPWQEKIVSIYRGPAGKGSALRSIFEAAVWLDVKACAVVDADIRSITSNWIKSLIEPVLENGYQFVAPVYIRHKYDGTITNNIVYYLIRALYGKRIRQPIGGDFAFSKEVADFYISQPVWDTDVARFGVDIWMTTEAIFNQFEICQACLGVKVHEAKDPAVHLGPMFRQVMWTLFSLMEEHETYWKKIKNSIPVKNFGCYSFMEPEPIKIDLKRLIYYFKIGFKQFKSLWKEILDPDTYETIKTVSRLPIKKFHIPTEIWARILYELAATFHYWPINRHNLINIMEPLYYGRVASFVVETWSMSNQEAEELVEKQAQIFEEQKEYLLKIWETKKEKFRLLANKIK
ncbi:MAG TPA: glycosyltransferase family 2 protein [Candidatus Desulfofervidus auxilii]|uniref:Glycosyltransferase family 2 protein n=1 Tax=Desulfofervidus auxilii TaxID=1621989 RepID=A0A7C2AKG9_DESA2|nr:glycosyltransferase family 2 protein [Candidatus Desulfofervidus auxilii]